MATSILWNSNKKWNIEFLENLWKNFLVTQNIQAKQISIEQQIFEGTPYNIIQTRYERDSKARTICLDYYGYSCFICEFNFENTFGNIGKEFIHVHHLNQLSITKEIKTNPIKDLRPVCPNCHAMLHKKNPPYSIDEIKSRLS